MSLTSRLAPPAGPSKVARGHFTVGNTLLAHAAASLTKLVGLADRGSGLRPMARNLFGGPGANFAMGGDWPPRLTCH